MLTSRNISLFLLPLLVNLSVPNENWQIKKNKNYSLYYKNADKKNIREYERLIRSGMKSVRSFFKSDYTKVFDVYVHPGRASLDSTWRHDWNMPEFKSECWMVASGVANRMDMISPKQWDKEACEHKYAESKRTERLITHELVHVYHGQVNASPDFNNVDRMDWFIEGMASFASGQCDESVINDVKKAIAENKLPASLDEFWTGRLRYGLSGSIVKYIDHRYGRSGLKTLLGFNKKEDLLRALNIKETDLIKEWKNYISRL